MSYEATAWARAQKTGNPMAKAVLRVLADYAGTDFSCYPSVRKLADETEMGESTVRSATKLLAELGLIRVFYRHRPDGSRRSSRYQLLVDGPDTMEPDAEDWADYRRLPADAMRQEPADAPPAPSGPPRQELAVIPSTDPSPIDTPPVVQRASRSERATRVPENFWPTEEMRAWFASEKLGQVINGTWEHEKFMDYWRSQPGTKGRKLDWVMTWRNWMRAAAERAGRGRPQRTAPQSTTDQRVAQAMALAEELRRQEEEEEKREAE